MGRQFSIVLLLVFVGTCCCQDTVRLVGGNGPKEGRVEVFIDGEWGTICDDLWDINDGHVICRQLGYSGADTIRNFAYFGEGSGRIWLDNVECAGDEETIADCRKNQFGDHNCQHHEDAGVECSMQDQEPVTEITIEDIRLVGGSSANVGRLEVFVDGHWGTVCDDDWDINDATVVCRQLGFPSADSSEGFAFFGQGSDPIWLDNVRCSGEEDNLNDCPKNDFGEHNCNHYEDAGVRCSRTETVAPTVTAPPVIEDIRLVGGTSEKEGRVEVYINGEWGTVCDDAWDQIDSDVVCRQLGYTGAAYIRTSEFFGQGEGRIWLDNVECTGSEESLQDCPKNDIGDENCGHSEDVGVECIPLNDSTSPAISTQRWRDDFQCGGRLIAPNGQWAECNPDGPNPCCSSYGWCDVTPSHCECAGCIDYRLRAATSPIIQDIRLADGRTMNMGRIEVQVNGMWGAVCDDLWDMNDATVVCKQLGFPGAEAARQDSYFGRGPDIIWLDNVECVGDETTLDDCPKNDIGDENCGGSEHAGVVCHPRDTPSESVVYLIYSEAASIQLIPLGENHQDPIPPLTNVFNVISIAPVYSKTGIFFSDIYNGSILYTSLKENNTVAIREGIGSVEGLAYNHITEEIFWTSYTNSSISRMKVFPHSTAEEVKEEEVLVRMSARDHPRGIALDICNSLIFWTNWNELNPSIMTASMAGKDVRAIITTDIQMPNGIIIDAYASKLYWCDARLDKIERANLDGTNRVVISETEPAHPFDLVIDENNLYWTDWVHREVRRVNKFSGENMVVLRSELSRSPMGIAILEEPHNCSALPCTTNNGGCEEICGTDEYGAVKCSCMEGKRLTDDNHTCVTYYQDIRLIDGQSENEGRVEVLVMGDWGTVCDDMWDLDDAMVVCKELGYPGAEAYFLYSHFGDGTGFIWLDNVDCSGDENSLNDCMKNSIGNHDCTHHEDAGVKCTESEAETWAAPVALQSSYESDEYLIYSEGVSIQMISLGENHEDPIPLLNDQANVIAIAPVFSKRGVFFSDNYKGGIFYHSMRENNTVTILEGAGSVEGIAYNHLTDEIFWTSYTNSCINHMKVFPHNIHGKKVLLSISANDHPRGIALDICHSAIFWTNWNEQNPSIMTATMKGEDYHAVITTDIIMPNGIVIDTYASKFYWCDARLDKIERANLDGTNRVVIIDSYLVHPFDLAIHENSLYWTDWGRAEVIRVDKYTGEDLTVLRSGLLRNPMGITLLEEPHNCSALPCATVNGGCQEICATDEYGTIHCSCNPGKHLAHDNATCLISFLTTSSTTAPTTTTESSISTKGTPASQYRHDRRCGVNFTAPNGQAAICDPNGDYPCCSSISFCGNTIWHCECEGCIDYRITGLEYRTDRRCGRPFYAPNGDVAKCDPDGRYPCCSNHQWCGSSTDHCECDGCLDYRIQAPLMTSSPVAPTTTVDSSISTKGTPVIEDIRLVDGYSHNTGRVEVYVNGEWGTVCHDKWEREDAEVACRWLGYTGADAAQGNAFYGEGTGPIWLDNVRCKGDEETLRECRMRPIGDHNCGHDEDAGVECSIEPTPFGPRPGNDYRDDLRCRGGYSAPNFEQARCNRNGAYPCCSPELWCGNTPEHCECEGCVDYRDSSVKDIRLSGPYPHVGQVEVFIFGEWGSVCNDYWDIEDANVACRMLGYSGADEIKRGDYYGEGYDPVLMDDVHCKGDEESLSDCPRNEPGYHDCDHRYEAASVVCTLPPSSTLPPPMAEEAMQYRHDRRCGESFIAPNGDAAKCDPNSNYPCCSLANFCGIASWNCECEGCIDYRITGSEYRTDRRCGSTFYAPNGKVAKCDPNGRYPCCSNYHYCGSSTDYCECDGCLDYRIQGSAYRIDLRCGGNHFAPNGNIARCDPNGPYPCCSNYHWCGSSSAHCDCSECIDYRHLAPLTTSSPAAPGTTVDSSITPAPLMTSSPAAPTTTADSSISTKGTPVIEDIRLVNGYSHNTGRVEVYVNGEWGTVCHDKWEREDAEVACRWLGYTAANAALGNAFFGEGTGPIWLDNVRCNGDEETLRECRMRPIGEHNCGHDEDAGVECTIVPTPFGPRPGNDYRDDLRCRGGYSAPNFGQARCNRNGAYPCCSPEFWCGNTPEHCECEGCVDYRDSSVKDISLSPFPHAGKVEVFIFGEWGSVCNDYWDIEDANVACRMLGYSGADEIKRGDYYGEGLYPVLMDDVHCKGDEESLSDCPRNEPGYHDCDHRYEAASVVCTLPPSTTLPPPTTEDPDQDYRNDYRCGGDYLAPNGEVAKCKKDGQYPCCSPEKWCGITADHCDCARCIDYRYHD